MTPNPWLISFGDLLTLLLCFFLTVISISPLNPQAMQVNSKLDSSLTTISDYDNFVSNPEKPNFKLTGTQIADYKSIVSAQNTGEVGFLEGDFVLGGETLNDKARNQLKELDLRSAAFLIEVCKSGSKEDQSLEWNVAEERASALKRQLIDLGLPDRSISLKVLGPHCELLSGNKKPDSLAAVVKTYSLQE